MVGQEGALSRTGTASDAVDAVFLDRDGTINVERADYVKSMDEFEWLPGALDALRVLAGLGVPIIIITNQSAIGRGVATQAAIDSVHAQMCAAASAVGAQIDAVYLCPHHPNDGCACRKPSPGLLLAAAADHKLDLRRCVFIGDSVTDLAAARAAGCRSILVRTGRQAQRLAEIAQVDPDMVLVDDLMAAVGLLTMTAGQGPPTCEMLQFGP